MIEAAVTELVRTAPAFDPATLAALLDALHADGRALALAIARVVEAIAERRVDGVVLPVVAMACATLCDPRSTERELDAARFEVETLVPTVKPDVLASELSRARRRQT
jgi:hypothetical protein